MSALAESVNLNTQLSLCASESLPKTFSATLLALMQDELIALQYATSQLPGDNCLQHTLCAKLDGYRMHMLATADSVDAAENILFRRCLQLLECWPKDEKCIKKRIS